MKVFLIGAFGTIGSNVADLLKEYGYEVITAGRHQGDVRIDIADLISIKDAFRKVGHVDAIVNVAGAVKVVPITQMTPEDNMVAINSKLLGQINLALVGQHYLNDRGSITLTTGVTKDDPIAGGASGAMANEGVAAFVKSAAIDLPRGLRINCVSPTIVEESYEQLKDSYAGFTPIPARLAATGYLKSVHGQQTGREYRIYR